MGAFPPASSDANKSEPKAPEPADAGCSGNLFALARELKTLTERLQEAFTSGAAAPDVDNLVRDAQAVGDVLQKALPAPTQPAAIEAPVTVPSSSEPHVEMNIPYNQRTDIDHSITEEDIMNAQTDEERIDLISRASYKAIRSVLRICRETNDVKMASDVCHHYNKANGPVRNFLGSATYEMSRVLLPHMENKVDFILRKSRSVAKRLSEGIQFPKTADVATYTSSLLHKCAETGDLYAFRYFYHLYVNCGFKFCASAFLGHALTGGNRDIVLFLRDTAGFNLGDFRNSNRLMFFIPKHVNVIRMMREDLLFSDKDLNADFVDFTLRCGDPRVIVDAVKARLISKAVLAQALKRDEACKRFVECL